MVPVLIAAGLNLVVLALLVVFVARNIVRVPPDTAVVLTGRKAYRTNPETGAREMVGYRHLTGGSTFRIPIIERVDYLPLSEMAVEVDAEDLRDTQGLTRSVGLLVNCRISEEPLFMERAIRRFLTMELPDIENIVRTTIESRIANTLLATDLSSGENWPGVEASLDAAIREDLAALGIEVDTLIFRDIPISGSGATAANGRGSARIE